MLIYFFVCRSSIVLPSTWRVPHPEMPGTRLETWVQSAHLGLPRPSKTALWSTCKVRLKGPTPFPCFKGKARRLKGSIAEMSLVTRVHEHGCQPHNHGWRRALWGNIDFWTAIPMVN